jgi:hypothetical protein
MSIRGKSVKAIANDVADGYVVVNPLFLKSLDVASLKELHREMMKVQITIRAERFPSGDIQAIRWRNTRLQRLNSAVMILANYSRERRINLL